MAGLVPAILACDRLQKIISSVLVLSLTDYKPNDRNSAPCLVKEAQPVRRKRGMGRRSKPWAKPLGFGRQIEKVQSFLDLNQKSPVER
jgi:hypothetical protein